LYKGNQNQIVFTQTGSLFKILFFVALGVVAIAFFKTCVGKLDKNSLEPIGGGERKTMRA